MEKYFRSGRYWELLRLLESEGLVSTHIHEYKESWKAVIRDALKHGPAFHQFLLEVGMLKSLPDDPGLRFLMILKGYLEGRNAAEDLLELKNLPPDAEKLKSNFVAFISSALTGDKLRNVLEKFLTEPDKITRRHYEQIAGMLPGKFGKSAIDMGELISRARRFNHKTVASGGWDAIDISDLDALDSSLMVYADVMPPALREIFLHPFVHNISLMCRRIAPEALINRASQLVGSMPYLLPRLAGERLDEVEQKLSINCSRLVEGDDKDRHDELARKTEGLGLEEKLALLSGLRLKIRGSQSGEADFGVRDNFDDEWDGEDEFDDGASAEEHAKTRQLTGQLLFLYRCILSDISGRLPGLSPRERKELVRVMEPILLEDLKYTLETIQGPKDLMDFLEAVLKAGCAGVRMGLLTFLIGSHHRNGDLRRNAEKCLDQSPAPTQHDMEWLATEWTEYFFPRVRSLGPLLARYEQNESLLRIFCTEICSKLEFSLFKPIILEDFAIFNLIERKASKPEEPGIVRRELDFLIEFKLLDIVRQYLRCYPDDRFTVEGYLCWLNSLRSYRPEEVWQFVLSEVRGGGKWGEEEDDFFPLESLDSMVAEKLEAMILFIMEHSEDLASLPMDTLRPLLDELLKNSRILRNHLTFLIRLEKVLAERVDAGDAGVRTAMDKIRRFLQKQSKSGRKSNSKRKSRR